MTITTLNLTLTNPHDAFEKILGVVENRCKLGSQLITYIVDFAFMVIYSSFRRLFTPANLYHLRL